MVSILMPVYNAAPYLEECLSSIASQTLQDWELIAVDDHSSDDSRAILDAHAPFDDRIHVIENSGKGIIEALRTAYAQSQGECITRMDADDIMMPHKLEQLHLLCAEGTIVTGKVEYFRSDGPLGDGYRKYADWLNGLVDTERHWKEIYKECVIPSPAWMMTRDTLDVIGAFDADRYPEDYDLIFRAYQAGLEVSTTDKIIHRWRDHGTRASRNDPNYADNRFLEMKLKYFLAVDRQRDQKLILWGAGAKGKILARQLNERGIDFEWISDNPRKQQAPIYGHNIQPSDRTLHNSQCIIAVASSSGQEEIAERLSQCSGVETFWFC
ncbi:MAG: glycosyltransferase [Flavobacteriales bacterium]|nr:glycosyltransferase [Flavobacteriales bacterium]